MNDRGISDDGSQTSSVWLFGKSAGLKKVAGPICPPINPERLVNPPIRLVWFSPHQTPTIERRETNTQVGQGLMGTSNA